MKIFAVVTLVMLALGLPGRAQTNLPDQTLDQKIEALYQEVLQKFEINSWFKNEGNPELYSSSGRNLRLPPEYAMPTLDQFKSQMKSYCVLMESPSAKTIKRPDHYSVVDYTDDATFRRLYVYDVKNREFMHNTWTTHGTNSSLRFSLSLSDTQSGQKDTIMSFNDPLYSAYFSNEEGTNQSSVGMAIADPKTYWSQQFSCNALRMNGVDGSLNDRLLNRAIVVHAFDYRAADIGQYRHVPLSLGCVMLQRSGFYKGISEAPIADLIIQDLLGSPILLYHERMNTAVNEKTYQDQLTNYAKLQETISDQLGSLAPKYGWTNEQTLAFQSELNAKLKKEYRDRVEQTYRYFKTPSKFVGREPKSARGCMKALNLN